MNKKLLGPFALVLIMGAGCTNTGTVNTISETSLENTPEVNDTPMDTVAIGEPNPATDSSDDEGDEKLADTVKEFTVSGGNFAFAPNVMTVKKGDTVKIIFKNDEGFHDLVIDEFKVATKQIAAGAEETVEFVADKAGTFEYYCSVGKHREMGMVGTLMVTE